MKDHKKDPDSKKSKQAKIIKLSKKEPKNLLDELFKDLEQIDKTIENHLEEEEEEDHRMYEISDFVLFMNYIFYFFKQCAGSPAFQKIGWIVLFVFFNGNLFAQNKIDSLERLYQNATELDEKFDALGNLMKMTLYKDREMSKKYALRFDSIAYAVNDSSRMARAKVMIGNCYYVGEEYDKALNLFLEGLEIAEKRNDYLQQASLNTSLCAVLWAQKDTSGTLRFGKKALSLYEVVKDTMRMGIGCTNLGILYKSLEERDSASYYLNRGIEYYRLTGNNSRAAGPLLVLADIENKRGNNQKALTDIDEAIDLMDGGRNLSNLVEAYFTKINILWDLKKLEEGAAFLEKAEQVIIENDLKKEARTLPDYWAHYYEKKGDYKNALLKTREHFAKDKETFSLEKNKNLNELLTKYETEKKEAEIERLALAEQLSASQISLQRVLIGGLGIGLALLSFLFYRLSNQKKKIKSQNLIISKSLKEKDTLLREIHHRVKNNLQLVSSLLSLQSKHVEDPTALEVLNSGKSRVRSMALIHQDLYNRENLTGVKVKDYLEKLCKELLTTYQVDTNRIELHTEIADLHLDVDTLVPLGLIINELLTNALKYAFPDNRSGEIRVKIFETAGQLQLEVQDDGIGINPDNQSDSSFGYKLINTLLYQLQGELRRESNAGTHIFLTFNNYKIAA